MEALVERMRADLELVIQDLLIASEPGASDPLLYADNALERVIAVVAEIERFQVF